MNGRRIDFLARITRVRAADAAVSAAVVPEEDLLRRAKRRTARSLTESLRRIGRPWRILAETKKASPSAGLLCPVYTPATIARAYEDAGAAAISVLTEPHLFLGSDRDIEEVRAAVSLPVLRKDFLSTDYQVLEAAAWGADAVLLIVAALDPGRLRRLHRRARALGLETLVEVHTERELAAALALEGAVIGVNNRNLKTLKTDLAVARSLARRIPTGRVAVAESGLRTPDELRELQGLGYRGFLIGESLLRTGQPGVALRRLLGAGRS